MDAQKKNKHSHKGIFYYRIMVALAIAALFFLQFYKQSSPYGSIERALYGTFQYLPMGILGIVTALQPRLSKEGALIKMTRLKWPSGSLLAYRVSGILWTLISLIQIHTSWIGWF